MTPPEDSAAPLESAYALNERLGHWLGGVNGSARIALLEAWGQQREEAGRQEVRDRLGDGVEQCDSYGCGMGQGHPGLCSPTHAPPEESLFKRTFGSEPPAPKSLVEQVRVLREKVADHFETQIKVEHRSIRRDRDLHKRLEALEANTSAARSEAYEGLVEIDEHGNVRPASDPRSTERAT